MKQWSVVSPQHSRLAARCSLLVAALFLLSALLPPAPVAAEGFADPAVEAYWSRAHLPVAAHMTPRSWLWGPAPFASAIETYKEAYLDKEIAQRVS